MHKILLSIREILQFFPKWKKVVDVRKKYVIIICSAIKIPEQSYDAQYRTGGEVRCETMSNVIVKENETLDSALRRFKIQFPAIFTPMSVGDLYGLEP